MTTSAGYPEPGESFGIYRIERRLGVGGMGVVFEATDTTLDRRVALKVISPAIDSDETFRARFRQEAQGQASLDSPQVVSVYAHGEVEGRLYIATQLIPDGDLGAMITSNGAPPLRTALDLMAQVCAGLADAHDAGLVHRDIKPPNVLLRRRADGMRAYLADFGIARHVHSDRSLTTAGGTIGTPTFMAPELHTGGTAGPATDIYSMGCLLWASLVGAAPYSGTSDYQIVSAHLESPIPQLAGNEQAVTETNRILRTAMAKDPFQRYPTARAMRTDLQRALAMPAPRGPVTAAAAAQGGDTRPETPPDQAAAAPVRTPTPTPSPMPSLAPAPHLEKKSRTALYATAAILLIVLLGLGGYFGVNALLNSGSTQAGSGSDDETSPSSSGGDPTEGPSESPSDEPTESGGGPTGEFTAEQEERAKSSTAEALQNEVGADFDQIDTRCVADEWIDGVGLERMVELGFFDDDFAYVDIPQEDVPPDVQASASSAVLTCSLPSLE